MFALYIDLSKEDQLLQFYDKFVQYNSDFIKSFTDSLNSVCKLQSKDELHLTIGLFNNNEQQKLDNAISVIKNLSDDFPLIVKARWLLVFN